MIKPTVSINVKGEGNWKKLLKTVERIKYATVKVGITDASGTYPDGTSVFMVSLWNEFGTEHIPSRPAIRQTLLEQQSNINRWRVELLKQVIEGKITLEKALSTIGFRLREKIRAKILSDMPPPNAPSTALHKEREGVAPRTLVETGLYARSVDFKVVVNR